MSTCHNNPQKSSITKINECMPSGYSFFFPKCLFDSPKNNLIAIEVNNV